MRVPGGAAGAPTRAALAAITGAAVCAALWITAAQAQGYPSRPVRLIVPFTPAGGTDILARAIGQKLSESTGQQFVVDNRPGAGGTIGADLTAKAMPDGYTLIMVSASYTVNASLYKLSFDSQKDLAPITLVASVPFVLLAHPSLPANNVKELIALAKAKPGSLNYASSGSGGSAHLSGELLKMMAGIEMTHIPYKGGGPALADVLAGQVQLIFNTIIQSLPQMKAGRLKALAVGSPRRSQAAPEVPTIAESGVPGFDVTNWFGLLAPGATPKPVIVRIQADVAKHLASAELRERLAAEGADAVGSTPEAFGQVIRTDIEKYAKIVKAANVRIN